MRYTLLLAFSVFLFLSGCSASDIETVKSNLGTPSNMAKLQASLSQPGFIKFEKYTAANWVAPLSGVVNLDHPKAIAAGLEDREEAVQIFVYVIQHPTAGTYLIDAGMSEQFLDPENNPDVSFIIKKAMNIAAIETLFTIKQLMEKHPKIDGVLLTHIHLDHIMGLTELPKEVPVYLGSGDADAKRSLYLVTRGSTNRLLAKTPVLQELSFENTNVLDIFGDGSLWAISAPGHSPGSVAYLARTTEGPQLMVGDVTHTRWGWDNLVEPGSFTQDIPLNAASLKMLGALVEKNPEIKVHPGHQE